MMTSTGTVLGASPSTRNAAFHLKRKSEDVKRSDKDLSRAVEAHGAGRDHCVLKDFLTSSGDLVPFTFLWCGGSPFHCNACITLQEKDNDFLQSSRGES